MVTLLLSLFTLVNVIPLLLNQVNIGYIKKSRKGLIFYKTEIGTSAMKKYYEVKYSKILKTYVNEIANLHNDDVLLQQMPLRNKVSRFKKL